jgi:acyl-CoA thioesterase-2
MAQTTSRYLTHLLEQLELDQLDRDMFLGDPRGGQGRLFGGLVAAQAVVAGYRTVEEGVIHSMHAYFLRPGRHDVPIRYVVYRIRDGRTFTTRDVVAYQAGEAIFNVSCSFARPEKGVSRQEPMPEVPPPEKLPPWDSVRPDRTDDERRWHRERPVDVRACDPEGTFRKEPPHRRVWIRPRGSLPEDPIVHAAMIAYSSDMGFLSTAHLAMQMKIEWGASASLDHVVWFHHPPRFDDWLLFTSYSPIAQNARALILGQMHRRDGTQVASIAQEGLIRQPRG